ncbi:MAG: hypothetical protein R3251_03945, partial [Candidatus Spechtbacterales bacterium]|nr:hypothetical protein [Candidatus Spechtbacterales bacterium]
SVIGERIGASGSDNIINAIPSMQFVVIIFFVGAFVLRFAFPSFSQEGRASWVLGSSPIDLRQVFFQKLKLHLFLSFAIGGLASVMFFIRSSDILAGLELAAFSGIFQWFIFLPTVLLVSITTAVIGLSLGIVFVNFKIEDPQLMSTSLPGMFLVFTFLILGFLGAVSIYQVILGSYFYLILLYLLSCMFSLLSVVYALKALKKIEFV